MIIWLEVPKSFRLITGAAQKDVGKITAGAKMKKTGAYADLCEHMNGATGSRWTRGQAKSRYKSLMNSYKKIRDKVFDKTGEKYCLTPEELAKARQFERKIESEFAGFRRMDELFGSRENINPSQVDEPGDNDDDCIWPLHKLKISKEKMMMVNSFFCKLLTQR